MAVFQGGSLLPEDRFINTFHFNDIGAAVYEDFKVEACTRVRAFYQGAGTEGALGPYLSQYIQRIWNIQAYDMTLPPGEREPYIETGNLTTVSTGGLPEEVAICLTLHGESPITPRRRGRLYIGPLANQSNVLQQATSSLPARPEDSTASNIVDVLLEKATVLADVVSPLKWCIRSVTPSENYVAVTGGWVDNAFDTQRRRGPDPTARRAWGFS